MHRMIWTVVSAISIILLSIQYIGYNIFTYMTIWFYIYWCNNYNCFVFFYQLKFICIQTFPIWCKSPIFNMFYLKVMKQQLRGYFKGLDCGKMISVLSNLYSRNWEILQLSVANFYCNFYFRVIITSKYLLLSIWKTVGEISIISFGESILSGLKVLALLDSGKWVTYKNFSADCLKYILFHFSICECYIWIIGISKIFNISLVKFSS